MKLYFILINFVTKKFKNAWNKSPKSSWSMYIGEKRNRKFRNLECINCTWINTNFLKKCFSWMVVAESNFRYKKMRLLRNTHKNESLFYFEQFWNWVISKMHGIKFTPGKLIGSEIITVKLKCFRRAFHFDDHSLMIGLLAVTEMNLILYNFWK